MPQKSQPSSSRKPKPVPKPKAGVKKAARLNKESGKRKKVTAIIDESGNPGIYPVKNDSIFLVGATIIDDEGKIGKISEQERKRLHVKELKYIDNPRSREYMEGALAKGGAHVVGVFVDKKNSPLWWRINIRRSWMHRLMLHEISKDLAKTEQDYNRIVIDKDTSLKRRESYFVKKEGQEIVESRIGSKRKIYNWVTQEDSAEGLNKNLLQSGDFGIGATRRVLEGIPPSTPVKFKVRNLKNNKIVENELPASHPIRPRPGNNSTTKKYKKPSKKV